MNCSSSPLLTVILLASSPQVRCLAFAEELEQQVCHIPSFTVQSALSPLRNKQISSDVKVDAKTSIEESPSAVQNGTPSSVQVESPYVLLHLW